MAGLGGFDAFVCDALVDALVAARVLKRTACGRDVINRVAHWPREKGTRVMQLLVQPMPRM